MCNTLVCCTTLHRKGIRLIFLSRDTEDYGNVSEPEETGGGLEKSSLFFLTAYYPGISLPGDRVTLAGKAP